MIAVLKFIRIIGLASSCLTMLPSAAIADPADAMVGKWRAESLQPHDGGPVVLDIAKAPDGTLSVLPLGTSALQVQIQRQPATVDGNRATAVWNEGDYRSGYFPLDFVGEVRGPTRMDIRSGDTNRLSVAVIDDRRSHQLTFRRYDDVSFRKFDVPRLDVKGRPVTSYAYQVPAKVNWITSASAASTGIDEALLTSMVSDILAGKLGKITAVSIIQDGKLVLDEYFFGQHRGDIHTVMSVTKSFTSLAYGAELAKYPQLAPETPVWRYFPERTDTRWVREKAPVTVSQLLRMAAVTPFDERKYDNPDDPLLKSTFSDDPVASYLGFDLSKEPVNDRLSYFTAYTMLVGEILGKVTSHSIDRLIGNDVLRPLGIERFAMPRYDRVARRPAHPDGTFFNGSFLQLSALDLAKVGQMVLNKGTWRSRQVVPIDWIAAATTVRSISGGPDDDGESGYGYGFWIRRLAMPDGTSVWGTYMNGLGGQILFVIPQTRTVVSINAVNYGRDEMSLKLIESYIAPAILRPKGSLKWGSIGREALGKTVVQAE